MVLLTVLACCPLKFFNSIFFKSGTICTCIGLFLNVMKSILYIQTKLTVSIQNIQIRHYKL